MNWEIEFGKGCGPLRFGMSADEVGELLGPPGEQVRGVNADKAELRNDGPWRECAYLNEGLTYIQTSPIRLESLLLDRVDLLSMPILSVVEILGRANSSIGQAQGGSLYFENIGAAILQFEDPDVRDIILFSAEHDHGEPLMSLSLSDVEDYYAQYYDLIDAQQDLFKPVQKG